MKITVTAFIFNNGKLLIVFHRGLKRWMHVGGHLEKGESFSEGLLREIKEETNLDVEILDFDKSSVILKSPLIKEPVPFFIHTASKEGKRRIMLDYIAIAKDVSVFALQESELSGYKWITKEELKNIEMIPVLKELALKAFSEYELI